MSQTTTIRRRIHFRTAGRHKTLIEGPHKPCPAGRIPRVTRLMALAIRLEQLVCTGQVRDYAALASLGHVTRARVTQITNLTLLAPDIQEAVLFLPRVHHGPDPITERDLRPIIARPDWQKQRQIWRRLRGTS